MNKKRNELTSGEALLWICIWLGLVIVSIFPYTLNFIVKDILNMSRTLDFFIIVGFLIMFGIIYYIFTLTKRTENKIEGLVRDIALGKVRKK